MGFWGVGTWGVGRWLGTGAWGVGLGGSSGGEYFLGRPKGKTLLANFGANWVVLGTDVKLHLVPADYNNPSW